MEKLQAILQQRFSCFRLAFDCLKRDNPQDPHFPTDGDDGDHHKGGNGLKISPEGLRAAEHPRIPFYLATC